MLPSSYVEPQGTSTFSFLCGASHPHELVRAAADLGHQAIALTIATRWLASCAHVAAKEAGIRFVVGALLDLQDAPSVLVYPTDRQAYGRLSRLITVGRRGAPKGECFQTFDDRLAHADGKIIVALPPSTGGPNGVDALAPRHGDCHQAAPE